MCKNDGDKAMSRVLPLLPPPARFLIYFKQVWGGGKMEKRAYLRGGGGGGSWNIQKNVSILQKELELELVK